MNVALGTALVAGGLGAWWLIGGTSTPATASRTTTVTRSTVLSTVTATGNVEAARESSLSFGSSGEVKAVNVTVGQTVAAGDELARIDDSTARSQLRTAEANYEAAREKLAQLEDEQTTTTTAATRTASAASSSSAQAPTDADIAAARSQVVAAEGTVDSAKKSLDETVITAPYSGVISAVNVEVGQTSGSSSGSSGSSTGTGGSASSGGGAAGGSGTGASGTASASSSSSASAITLIDTTSLSITVGFSEVDATKVHAGQAATVSFDALSGVEAAGRVTQVSPTSSVSNNVVTYPATVVIPSPPEPVKVGMSATATVIAEERDAVLSLPSAAVTRQGTGSTATVTAVADDGSTRTTQVETGLVGDDAVEITSGLAEGQRVAIQTATSAASGSGATRSGTGGTSSNRGGAGGFPGGGPPGGVGGPR